MQTTITTTAKETFGEDDHARLAFLVFRRFGRDVKVGAVAWRRMLQNSATDADFAALVKLGEAL